MYVPQWETLADALARVLATGMEPEQAKQQISAAVGDGAIPVRVEIDKTESDIPAKIRSSPWQVKPPLRLRPDDLDWLGSKPKDAWATGPDGVENYAVWGWRWRSRRIAMLELRTDHVIRILCCPAPDTEAGSAALPTLAKLHKRLEDDGAPADGDGGQAELERFVAQQFLPDACPAESTIRTIVRKEIEAFRGDVEGR